MILKRYLSSLFLMGLLAMTLMAHAERKTEISSKTFGNAFGLPRVEIGISMVEPMEKDTVVVGGYYVVEKGEDLYDIAKKFCIDLSYFKENNPGLDNYPVAGTKIMVPNIVNEQDYIIHKVEYNERATSMLKRWKIKEKEFREKNISVGSHVFVNQIVLIPIEPVVVRPELAEVEIEEQEEEE